MSQSRKAQKREGQVGLQSHRWRTSVSRPVEHADMTCYTDKSSWRQIYWNPKRLCLLLQLNVFTIGAKSGVCRTKACSMNERAKTMAETVLLSSSATIKWRATTHVGGIPRRYWNSNISSNLMRRESLEQLPG